MDKRGKKIIYLSQCLLNQNLRFPGIAVESGAIAELLIPIIKNGIGIEPLPCLERLGWGGVKRKTFFKYFPMISKNTGSPKFPIIKLFLRLWLKKFKNLCKKETKKIILQMQDYNNSGYTILGIITTNDSPTCGYTKTINFLGIISKFKELGIKDEFENPTLEKMKNIIPSLCENGSGYFMSEITKLIKRSELEVDVIGFNVWNNLSEETQRVLGKLNLST
ncbi:MAG: hypothetical protein HWN81_21470 [Candidatus Lokiarchaeota archaeon]|nr:hypothetical protein [Candidatus Lokiarchaeota archaeon]